MTLKTLSLHYLRTAATLAFEGRHREADQALTTAKALRLEYEKAKGYI